jgi:6-phosphogluconolactonase
VSESEGPGEPTIVVLPDAAATSHAGAVRIAEALVTAVAERGRADWATTGGSTPLGIYRELATPPLRDRVPWGRVHIWWGDDRFVPRDDPLSNILACDQVLLASGVPIPPENVHAMPIEAAIGEGRDAAWAAAIYENELRAAPLSRAGSGVPILDVILVGLGADGHVLSVFPGSDAFDSGAWVAGIPAPTHVAPHVARVSINPGFLAAARLVLVVARGAGKATILQAVLGDGRDTRRWPIQYARRTNAVWLLDEACAAKLRA